MRINKLELSKVVSDLLFAQVSNPEEKAKKILRIKHSLTAHGFEKYMQYYFMESKGYTTSLNGNTYNFDRGIDLIGRKIENNRKRQITVQCKKYGIKDITEEQIRSFIGAMYVFDATLLNSKNSELYYITTSKFTSKALICAKMAGVKCISYLGIYNIQNKYSMSKFRSDIIEREGNIEKGKCFEEEQGELFPYYSENIGNQEVMQFLKQIRRDLKDRDCKKVYEIAKNSTLEIIAKKRPHNLQALFRDTRNLDYYEQLKIKEYGEDFIERLQYL